MLNQVHSDSSFQHLHGSPRCFAPPSHLPVDLCVLCCALCFVRVCVGVCLSINPPSVYTHSNRKKLRYLVDVDVVFLHVVPVVDLASFNELHGQNPIGRQVPMDFRDLTRRTTWTNTNVSSRPCFWVSAQKHVHLNFRVT